MTPNNCVVLNQSQPRDKTHKTLDLSNPPPWGKKERIVYPKRKFWLACLFIFYNWIDGQPSLEQDLDNLTLNIRVDTVLNYSETSRTWCSRTMGKLLVYEARRELGNKEKKGREETRWKEQAVINRVFISCRKYLSIFFLVLLSSISDLIDVFL